ncbi:protein translocase subunit SecD [Nocardioides alkalitolerans]|uniref:protein translocase subunit SecD n=1 Tax=Nocardioides alkalitolerans TaxID=281714 RepID=UPI00040CD97A|nr:protein translocase subunit SecD [Nocardioides alkalitolerans]
MSRGIFLRLLFVIALLAACGAAAWKIEPNLGIDLEGGSQITVTVLSDEEGETPSADQVDQVVEVLRQRVDGLGVSEATVVRSGSNRIIAELPGLQDPDQALQVIGQTAQLEVRPVLDPTTLTEAPVDIAEAADDQPASTVDEDGAPLAVGPVALKGDEITGAQAVQPQDAVGWAVTVDFSDSGSDAFGDLSREAACATGDASRIAILLDDKAISSPQVTVQCGASITGSTQITGDFTQQTADDLAVLIEGGSLPLRIASEADGADIAPDVRTIGPTLGAAAIKASAEAGIIGVALTGIFIIIVYRLVGFLATAALTSYALISYALLVFLGATLTLPGLAGFVLAIGMAIDANVLVFERAREEYAANKAGGMRRALQIGFNKAFTAILDTNVTTLIAAALLYFLASGPVRGFGVTLAIGVIASMVSALIIARVLTEVAVSSRFVARRPRITGLDNIGRVRVWLEKKNFQIIPKRKVLLIAASIFFVAMVAGIGVKGLNLGLEFTGGRNVVYATTEPISADDARQVVADAGFPEATVQTADEGDISVRTGRITDEEEQQIRDALDAEVGVSDVVADDSLGAALGGELQRNALIAFLVGLALQMAYLAFRFKWTFGAAAVAVMFHDVLIVIGAFAWLGKPVDGVFLAAALTIIGLSVNDTIVVFDRIREKWWASTDEKFIDIANKATLDTMPRTVNTGLGSLFILGALALVGGDSLQDFSIALLIGLSVALLSSVFVATPILTYLQEKAPFKREKREKVVRDETDSGAVV